MIVREAWSASSYQPYIPAFHSASALSVAYHLSGLRSEATLMNYLASDAVLRNLVLMIKYASVTSPVRVILDRSCSKQMHAALKGSM